MHRFCYWGALRAWYADLSCLVQGHALMTRHAGSANPCPLIDFDGGFNAWMAAAFNLPKGQTVEQKFGKPFGKTLMSLLTQFPAHWLCVPIGLLNGTLCSWVSSSAYMLPGIVTLGYPSREWLCIFNVVLQCCAILLHVTC